MDFLGGIFGAVGSVVGAKMQADAIKKATQMQIEALERQRQFVYDELEPGKIGAAAEAANIRNAEDRLALQAVTDPGLLQARYLAQDKILGGLDQLGAGRAAEAEQLAFQTAKEGAGATKAGQQALIDAALKEIQAGASLPSDLQAELVRAGLERGGMVTGAASPKGIGGQITRELIGSAGLALRQKRLETASGLLGRAQDLENSRQTLLTQLFPSLANTQLANLTGAQQAFQTSNAAVPQAGLTGTDVANLWLARVGATNQLASQAAQIGAQGGIASAQAWSPAIGAASQALAGVGKQVGDWLS